MEQRATDRWTGGYGDLAVALVTTINAAAVLVDDEGRMTLLNARAERLFGPTDGLLWPGGFELLTPSGQKVTPAGDPIVRCAAGDATCSETVVLHDRRDGRRIWLRIDARRLNGDVAPVLALLEDLPSERVAQRELEECMYLAVHDLKEPVRMVKSYLEIIRKDYGEAFDEAGLKFLGFAADGALRMEAQLKAMLTLLKAQTVSYQVRDVDLAQVARSAIDELRNRIEPAKVETTISGLPVVRGDSGQLFEVFFQLMDNAVKFRSPERSPVIEVTSHIDRGRVRVEVRDNGIGIDARHRESAFSVFRQLHPRGEYPGTGIGLAVCKKIVERHGGMIGFESAAEGSVFWFTLGADDVAYQAT